MIHSWIKEADVVNSAGAISVREQDAGGKYPGEERTGCQHSHSVPTKALTSLSPSQ